MKKKEIQRKKRHIRAPGHSLAVARDRQSTRAPGKKSHAVEKRVGVHNLVPPLGSHKPKKLLGRGSGSGHGKTSTRGSKGQTSRAGRDFYAGFEGGQTPLIRRIPKRGFTGRSRIEIQIVNIKDLARVKETLITPAAMKDKGLISSKERLIKILGEGEIKRPVTVQAHAFSRKAQAAIIAAGGKIEIISEATTYGAKAT